MTEHLSPTEYRIVAELADHGGTDRQVAERLSMNFYTYRTHMARARIKIGARNRTELVAWFIRTHRPPEGTNRDHNFSVSA